MEESLDIYHTVRYHMGCQNAPVLAQRRERRDGRLRRPFNTGPDRGLICEVDL